MYRNHLALSALKKLPPSSNTCSRFGCRLGTRLCINLGRRLGRRLSSQGAGSSACKPHRSSSRRAGGGGGCPSSIAPSLGVPSPQLR